MSMSINYRNAKRDDLPVIVEMIADVTLGSKRENFTIPLEKAYVNGPSKEQKNITPI